MQKLINDIFLQISNVVYGKPLQIKLALSCLLAKGHLLIEDLPGMGKTTLAQTLAATLGLSYQRTQFTSDLLPSDIIGISIFNNDQKTFELHKGPIFNQVVLADEINRAGPKTQSALLEAMEECQVSIDGITHQLPEPFFVIATQNPTYHAGTYPLPESQLDRFMMRISLGFPDIKAEKQILLSVCHQQGTAKTHSSNVKSLKPCISIEQLKLLQQAVHEVTVSEVIIEYIIALCHISRKVDSGVTPLSPRAGKSLLVAAKAWAFMENRTFVLPDDVQAVFEAVCQHRLESAMNVLPSEQMNSQAQQILTQVDAIQPFS
jgi:MoxR-like ATPase